MTVTGFVTDARTGERVHGARVLLLDTNYATTTDGSGRYTLQGMRPGEYQIAALAPRCRAAVGLLRLEPRDVRRIDLQVEAWAPAAFADRFAEEPDPNRHGAGSIRVFTAHQVSTSSAPTVTDFLWRVVPEMMGLSSGQPGSAPRIRGRAQGLRAQSSVPLLLVDGVLLGGESQGRGSVDAMGALDQIRARDVERIEILRGPSATALYGTGGAAGAIRIYTLRGRAVRATPVSSGFCPAPERRR
jgi:TonB-dependent SusC/RagA subfamily outer membrane receptor